MIYNARFKPSVNVMISIFKRGQRYKHGMGASEVMIVDIIKPEAFFMMSLVSNRTY